MFDNSNSSADDASGYDNGVDVGYDDNDENEGGDFLGYETEPDFAFDSDNLLNDAAELDEEIEQVLRQQSSLSNREKPIPRLRKWRKLTLVMPLMLRALSHVGVPKCSLSNSAKRQSKLLMSI